MGMLERTTIFLGAFLRFLVQPMIGNTLLPVFGGTATVKSLTVADGAKIAFADLSDVKQTYQGPTVLSEPQWSRLPEVWNGRTERGRWILKVATDEVTPDEGEPYTVWRLSTTFRPSGLMFHLR